MKVISYTEPSAPSAYYNHHHNSSDDDDLYQYSSDDDHNDDPSIPPPAPPLPVQPGSSSSSFAVFSTEKHRISSLGTTSTASSQSFSAASSTVPSLNTTNNDASFSTGSTEADDDNDDEEHRHQSPITTQDDRSRVRRPCKYASKKNQQKMRLGRTTSKNKNKKNKGVAFDVDDDDDQSNHAMITTAGNFRASTISALGMFSPTSTRNVQEAPTSTRDVLHDIQQAETEDYHNTTTTTGMMTPSARIKEEIAHFDSDNSQDHMLIHSLNNSYHTDDEDEGDIEGGGQETTTPPRFARYAEDPDEDDMDTSKSTRCCTACLGLGRSSSSEIQNRTLNTTSGDSDTSAANSSVTSQKRVQRQRELRIYYAIGLFIFILMCIFFGIGFYIIYHNNHGW